jgi:hypothetical protein
MPRGGTGSHFEGVAIEIDGRIASAVLKLGRLAGGPPTREALFFARHSEDSPMRTPRCYGVGEISPDKDTWVLMERLPRGKRLNEWTLDETREALINLAALHARFLGSSPAGLPRPFTGALERWLSYVPAGVLQIRSVFDAYPGLPRFASDRALDLLLALCDRPAIFRDAFARSPETLLHGDYHRANVVVSGRDAQTVYDWQHVCVGPPAYDVGVFWNTLGLTSKRRLLGLVDGLEVGERCLSWEAVKDTYTQALKKLRPDADIDAIFSCSDETFAWEIARQVMYMGPVMAESQAPVLRFVYRDHRAIGGVAIRLLGIDNVFRLYGTVFAEFEDRAARLLTVEASNLSTHQYVTWVQPVAAALSEDRRELMEFVASVRAEFWDEASGVHGWTNKDILAHLAGGNDQLVQTLLQSLTSGESIPPQKLAPDTDAENALRVAERRSWSIDRLTTELERDTAEVLEWLSQLSEADQNLRPGGLSMTVGEFFRVVQEEHHDLIHLQQLRAGQNQ